PLGLGVAVLLNQEFRGRTVARVCLLLPWATPPIIVALMFWWIFNASYGIMNFTLLTSGAIPERISFFSTPFIVLNTLAIIFVWKVFPLYAILFLSSLQNVPAEVLESSSLYGAGRIRRFRRIVFPYLKPTLAINCVLNALLSLLYSFDLVVAITLGGPGYESYMLSFYAYLTTFWYLDAGYGATIAYFTTALALIFAFASIKLWYKS
ncbi:MAG: carbohydrate ABC transporter permease, partial [Candidatus Bathyarchaeia archaeon]